MTSADTLRTFGETLRAARLEQRRSLDDLASAIKIHRRHLEAIEAGDLTKLPQGPYVTAFVREYARSLGLAVPAEYAPPRSAPAGSPKDPKVVSHPARGGGEEGNQLSQVARDTARFANTAVKSAVKTVSKTTESVVSFVETGGKEALEVLTSKGLWDEAEDTRRERHGLPPLERKIEAPPRKVVVENLPPPTPAYEHDTLLPAEFDSAPVRSSKRATNIVIALLALVFAGAAYFAIRMSRSESGSAPITNKDYVPAPVEKPQPMTVPKHENAAPSTATNAATAVKDSLRFMLRATQPVWVSIAPDGVPAYKGELKAGEVRSFRAAQKIVVNIGNQKSVAMTFNGAPLSGLPSVQNSSVVVRDLVLMRDHVTLGGNPVDFHKLTSAPSPPSAKIAPGVPPPAVSTEMAALAKKAKQIAAQKAKLKAAAAKGNSSSQSKTPSKKNAPPPAPIHPVEPVPPGP